MAKKQTSYQKLKAKIESLEKEKQKMFSDMVTLVRKPESAEAAGIKMNVNMRVDVNDYLWFGNGSAIALPKKGENSDIKGGSILGFLSMMG